MAATQPHHPPVPPTCPCAAEPVSLASRRAGRGFTLVELMIAACLLVILLGLAVSLSREVRGRSARVLTIDLLVRLEQLADAYAKRHGGQFPVVVPLVPVDLVAASDVPAIGGSPTPNDEPALQQLGIRNNRDFLRAVSGVTGPGEFADLPLSVYDPLTPSLRDTWGTPIAFMPASHSAIGMAPGNRPFFVSAGPDRRFLTRGDNLYSYEAVPHRE